MAGECAGRRDRNSSEHNARPYLGAVGSPWLQDDTTWFWSRASVFRGPRAGMKILVVADPYIPVPPVQYGGTERIVALTCQTLVSLGHTVHLLAAQGSRDYGGGLAVHHPASRSLWDRGMKKLLFQLNMARLSSSVDLVINHGRHDYPEFALRDERLPMAIWFHNPVLQRDIDLVMKRRTNKVKFVGVS